MADDPRITRIVLSALRFRDSSPELLRTLSDSQWQELLVYSDLSHLTLFLRLSCSDFFPGWVRDRVEQYAADNLERVALIESSYLEIQSAFVAASVEYVVLKGFAQVPDFASNLGARFQSDIDFFCPEESLPAATTTLRQLGYVPVPTLPTADHLPAMVRRGDWKWRGNMYDPEMPPSVELHHRMWNRRMMRFGPSDLNSFWSRRTTRCVEGLSFPGLHPIDNLGFAALQVLRDLLGYGLLAHKVYELAYFLHHHANNDTFWREWRSSHADELRNWQAVSFGLAHACFGCDLAPNVEDEINKLPGSILKWFTEYSTSSLKTYRTLNKDALWVHFALVRSLRDRLLVLMKVFPKAPDTERALGTAYDARQMLDGWKRFLRYGLYCLSRVPRHSISIPRILYHGVRTFAAPMPFRTGSSPPQTGIKRS